MNKFKLIAIAILAMVSTAKADWWSDFSITPFGSATHPNLGKAEYGSGLDVGYFINKTVSLHLANSAYQHNTWRGPAIDETSLLVRADLIRSSTERFVAYTLGGVDRSWEHSDYAFGVGLGGEVRLSKNISAGIDSRIRAWFKADKDVTTRGYLSFRF